MLHLLFNQRPERATENAKHSTQGFTLLELLVVIAIIGILFAIAAPGWLAYLNRQRLSSATDKALQSVRQVQTEAKSTKTPRAILFRNTDDDGPQYAVSPFPLGESQATFVSDSTNLPWRSLEASNLVNLPANNDGSKNDTPQMLVFDSSGAIAQPPVVTTAQGSGTGPAFSLQAALNNPGGTGGARRCILMNTLVGPARVAEGNDCGS
jgi:prepilin-type N-terminal cleavage/methylation domain-containing protein